MLSVYEAPPARHPAIDAFYREADYRGGRSSSDRLFAADLDGWLVGVVRLCDEEGVLVLRGMRVSPPFQRRGIGARLLSGLCDALAARECFLLGYAHLEKFYGAAGFRKIDAAALPPHLQARLRRYLDERPDVVPMRRAARASPAT